MDNQPRPQEGSSESASGASRYPKSRGLMGKVRGFVAGLLGAGAIAGVSLPEEAQAGEAEYAACAAGIRGSTSLSATSKEKAIAARCEPLRGAKKVEAHAEDSAAAAAKKAAKEERERKARETAARRGTSGTSGASEKKESRDDLAAKVAELERARTEQAARAQADAEAAKKAAAEATERAKALKEHEAALDPAMRDFFINRDKHKDKISQEERDAVKTMKDLMALLDKKAKEAGKEESESHKKLVEWLWKVLAFVLGAAGGAAGGGYKGYKLGGKKERSLEEIAELIERHPQRSEIMERIAPEEMARIVTDSANSEEIMTAIAERLNR